MLLLIGLVLIFGCLAGGQGQPPITNCPTPADSPCVCTTGIVDCSNKGLSEIPIFHATTDQFYRLQLGGNRIRSISGNAFQNLSTSEIYLGDNQIEMVFSNAFGGLEDVLAVLDLQNNYLNRLPDSLGTLNVLRSLNVQGNPLDGVNFPDDVLRQLGNSLTEIHLGDESTLVSWPRSLSHLPNLRTLDVIGGRLPILPPDAFHGFERTLRVLTIRNTSMYAMPLGISRLQALTDLNFDFNVHMGDAGILIEAVTGVLNSLRRLSLKGNGLTRFPEILSVLNTLQSFELDYNDLQYVRDEAMRNVRSNITSLSLSACGLERAPAALSNLTSLININLSRNNIGTFERHDLRDLRNLRSVNLANNPLKYISIRGFNDLQNLVSLDLSNTQLTEIPTAIRVLPNLQTLDLSVPRGVDCSCNLVWLKSFLVTHRSLEISGQCETVRSSIQHYLASNLPTCPGF